MCWGWSTWGSRGSWFSCALSHICRGIPRAEPSKVGSLAPPWLPIECQLVVPIPCASPRTLLSLSCFALMCCSSPACQLLQQACGLLGAVLSPGTAGTLSSAKCRGHDPQHIPYCCIKIEPQRDPWSGSWAALLTELNSSSLQALCMPPFPQSLKWKFYLVHRTFGQLSLQVLWRAGDERDNLSKTSLSSPFVCPLNKEWDLQNCSRSGLICCQRKVLKAQHGLLHALNNRIC